MGAAQFGRRAIQHDFAAGRAIFAAQNAHQRRFPGAILAQKRVNLAGAQVEIDAAQGVDTPNDL